jgi:hypothetical protein
MLNTWSSRVGPSYAIQHQHVCLARMLDTLDFAWGQASLSVSLPTRWGGARSDPGGLKKKFAERGEANRC